MDFNAMYATLSGPGGLLLGTLIITGLLYQLYSQAQKSLMESMNKRIDSLESGQKECDTRYGLLLSHVLSLKIKD